jgi:hypothetical protein
MSQRECAGFNWLPLSISAEEPISICPVTVSRAGPGVVANAPNAAAPKLLFQPEAASFSAPCNVRAVLAVQRARNTTAWLQNGSLEIAFCILFDIDRASAGRSPAVVEACTVCSLP